MDVYNARSAEEHVEAFYRWARSVWDKFEAHHMWALEMFGKAGVKLDGP